MGQHPDQTALLCETCGYPIEGIPSSSNCPECGTSVASSLPSVRTGSPWQRGPGVWSWLTTNVAMLRRAAPMFRIVRLDLRSGLTLMTVNLLVAATVLVAPWNGVLMGDPLRASVRGSAVLMAGAVASIALRVLLTVAILLTLTLVEWAGIQFFANRRGWRLTPVAAWEVVCHASVGWIVTAVTSWLGLILWLNVSYFGLSGAISRLPDISEWLLLGVPSVGAFFGLVIFELLVYTGVRQCRYANGPAPQARAAAA